MTPITYKDSHRCVLLKTATNNSAHSDEGRKILYRLLLLAVVVVYALIFVLDYLLKLHFTFFLLLSLFGFVIVMLFYMLFRVRKTGDKPVQQSEEIIKDEINNATETVFGDVIFNIDSLTGLTFE